MGLVLVQNFTNCNEARGSAPKGTEGMLHDACWLCAEEAWHGGVNWCGADCWGHLCVCECVHVCDSTGVRGGRIQSREEKE